MSKLPQSLWTFPLSSRTFSFVSLYIFSSPHPSNCLPFFVSLPFHFYVTQLFSSSSSPHLPSYVISPPFSYCRWWWPGTCVKVGCTCLTPGPECGWVNFTWPGGNAGASPPTRPHHVCSWAPPTQGSTPLTPIEVSTVHSKPFFSKLISCAI
jgi:hypothetical protein